MADLLAYALKINSHVPISPSLAGKLRDLAFSACRPSVSRSQVLASWKHSWKAKKKKNNAEHTSYFTACMS